MLSITKESVIVASGSEVFGSKAWLTYYLAIDLLKICRGNCCSSDRSRSSLNGTVPEKCALLILMLVHNLGYKF